MINGTTGEEAEVTLGVSTGSVFGPVGYIMHVNSIDNAVKHCSTYMYADDTSLMYAKRDVEIIEERLQADFVSILN
ncbi:unnamed protein product [Parnassius apollo]|uniref:(apollo) hypothetical protein n=1 Tax=Parnassius apollo TaxID=110799 RepID=A0A8S3WIX7_PARAO|nr:unnamed protein product [Parnassius apollo]